MTTSGTQHRRVRLYDGPGAVIAALRRVGGRPAYWPYLLVPMLVFAVLSGLALGASFFFARPAFEAALGSRFGVDWLDRALVILATLGAASAGLFVSALAATPLSAPALETLVRYTERDLGLPPHPRLTFVQELWCGLRAQATALLWTAPLWLLLLAIDLALPVLLPLTSGLRALLAAFGVAWALVDYPLTLRGIGVRERFRLLFGRALGPVIAFGATFAILFWLPCCGLALIGVGVVAATELVGKLSASDPAWRAALVASAVQPEDSTATPS